MQLALTDIFSKKGASNIFSNSFHHTYCLFRICTLVDFVNTFRYISFVSCHTWYQSPFSGSEIFCHHVQLQNQKLQANKKLFRLCQFRPTGRPVTRRGFVATGSIGLVGTQSLFFNFQEPFAFPHYVTVPCLALAIQEFNFLLCMLL